jgi:excisionase family DNA binding protein
MDQFYTIRQAQAILKISRVTLSRHIKLGIVPAIHVGGRVLIPAEFFEDLKSQARAQHSAAE